MIDLSHIEKYKENNRIEAKKALGGLPKSIWETYSAFANTLGGVILLGVEEHKDKTLHPVNLPDPEKMVKEFWEIVNNPNKVSVNILSEKHVEIREVDGNYIIAIHVPRAQRYDKPVYIESNPMSGTYRRNGEGDYRCTGEEVQSMQRDAAIKAQDMNVLKNMELDVFDYDCIRRFRARMKNYRPGHAWEELETSEFLYKLGAVGRSEDEKMHPTAAGLLMFGYQHEIVKEYPDFLLDYQEQMDEEKGITDRIISSSGDWSGNLYDFYFRVYEKMIQNVKFPFVLEMSNDNDEFSVKDALQEALANCLVNADYHGKHGVVIVRKRNQITFSNPGAFRIDIAEAKSGGVSDPRNTALIKMFNLIDVSEGGGRGIPYIFNVWKKQGWEEPTIIETFEPERITFSLAIRQRGIKRVRLKRNDKRAVIKAVAYKNDIIEYLTHNVSADCAELASYLDLRSYRVKLLLGELLREDIIVAEGNTHGRIYKLKA